MLIDLSSNNGYAIIGELARRAKKKNYNLGKTALQKHVYLLQTLFGVDCGYDFSLYTYGPFSSDLLSDLDTVTLMDGVDVSYDSSISGYRITPGECVDAVTDKAGEFIKKSSTSIDTELRDFGRYNAKELELRATTVYAEREARAETSQLEFGALLLTVSSIKPHFSKETIIDAIEELRSKGYIELK